MQKILEAIANLAVKSCLVLGLASLISLTNLILPQPGYAAPPVTQGSSEVIQLFEKTNPAATRAEVYDEVAKLNKNPKELIAAENKEEQAEEKAYAQELKAAKSAADK
ncbi:hypothetical protein [Chamaesiphon sp. VAR_48_metabat_403]|uniref:hypothetical protein n=1 Tax=Chamaesiphon sp. VAR_48_metabat_403 TaxID=2964700 RepID=UPI00286E5200|nr:hypothetical protein [Chamaesiphon sp. VAR_48_metabat_403]